jgi:toxin ParE1/3/4
VRRATFLASVRADLVEIQTYIARQSGSRAVARNFVAELRRRCHELAALPGTLGRARPELGPGLRSVSHKGYVIFFRYADHRFEVVDILEGHRDVDAFFGDGT